jgi:hypothetical protein
VSERPPFDPVRAGFIMLGAVIALFMVVVLIVVGSCAYLSLQAGVFRCENTERLATLMMDLLTVVIAFTVGFRRQPPDKE